MEPGAAVIYNVISIRQPWPWAIFNLDKDAENRSWNLPERYIGVPLLIHAGKSLDEAACRMLERDHGCNYATLKKLPRGGIVGALIFIGCTGSIGPESPWAEKGMRLQWWIGAAQGLPFHPCRGRLGFFSVEYPHEQAQTFEEKYVFGKASEMVGRFNATQKHLIKSFAERADAEYAAWNTLQLELAKKP